MKIKLVLLVLVFMILAISFVNADVGVGVAPSKMTKQISAGDSEEVSLLIFNTGDQSLDVTLKVTGEIAEFVEILTQNQIIDPEPKPQELPIKNGHTFLVKFEIPAGTEARTYSGSISATGGVAEGSTFGGNVGVVTKVDIHVVESDSFFDKIPRSYYIFLAVIVGILLLGWFLKKQGLSISFKNNKK